jgi:hypothetical protein
MLKSILQRRLPGGFKKSFPQFLNDNYIDSEQVKEKQKGIFIEGKNTE